MMTFYARKIVKIELKFSVMVKKVVLNTRNCK